MLTEEARCFGITGREAIVTSSEELFSSTSFAIPYTITFNYEAMKATYDFDVINRTTDKVIARGTDLLHLNKNGMVIKMDTLRHVYEQPSWVKDQICEPPDGNGPISAKPA